MALTLGLALLMANAKGMSLLTAVGLAVLLVALGSGNIVGFLGTEALARRDGH